MTTFRYMSVEQWEGVWVRPPVVEILNDPEVYVHQTAGSPYDELDAAEAFRRLNQIAQQGKGYSFLDYDDLVHYNRLTDVCTIGEGRGRWLSAATRDRNELGEAVVAFGWFGPPAADPDHYSHRYAARPHPAIVEGVALAIVKQIREGRAAPDATILGHRDNPAHPNATACPGDWLYAELGTIRRRVRELMNPTPDPKDLNMDRLYRPFGYSNVFAIRGGTPEVLDPATFNALGGWNAPNLAKFNGARDVAGGRTLNRPHGPTVAWLEHVTGVELTRLESEPIDQ